MSAPGCVPSFRGRRRCFDYMRADVLTPAKNALVFNPAGGLEQPLSAQERRAYQKSLDEMLPDPSR